MVKMPKRVRVTTDRKIHFISFSVYNHIPVFRNYRIAEYFQDNLNFYFSKYDCRVYGYVIMPHHVHLLFEIEGAKDISSFVRDVKKYFAYRVKGMLGESNSLNIELFDYKGKYRFWEQRFDELGITTEKIFYRKLNYIKNNPVRAGLAERFEEYPFIFIDV